MSDAEIKRMRFLVDCMLGRMKSWLRLFGYDTIYASYEADDGELLEMAKKEDRIVLSRDRELIERCRQRGIDALRIHSVNTAEQLTEVMLGVGIEPCTRVLRCTLCNELIKRLNKDDVKKLKEEEGYEYVPASSLGDLEFWQCTGCGHVFWEGGHWINIEKMVKLLRRRCMDAERLKKKLEHWIEHSEGHIESYEKAVIEADALGLSDLKTDLEHAVDAMEEATEWLKSAHRRLKLGQ